MPSDWRISAPAPVATRGGAIRERTEGRHQYGAKPGARRAYGGFAGAYALVLVLTRKSMIRIAFLGGCPDLDISWIEIPQRSGLLTQPCVMV